MEKRRETLLSLLSLGTLGELQPSRVERDEKRWIWARERAGGERAAVFGRWEKQVQEREAGLSLNFVSSFWAAQPKDFSNWTQKYKLQLLTDLKDIFDGITFIKT